MTKKKGEGRWKKFLLVPTWVVVSFILAQLLTGFGLSALDRLGIYHISVDDPIVTTLIAVIVYGLTLGLAVLIPVWLFRRRPVSRQRPQTSGGKDAAGRAGTQGQRAFRGAPHRCAGDQESIR